MAKDDQFTWVESDKESSILFFYCRLCPLTIPFLKEKNAEHYMLGHKLNSYHKRRLELLR